MIFFLGVAWHNVNNYSLVELIQKIQKMGKPSQKYKVAVFGTSEDQILLRLISTSFENRHRKSTSFGGILSSVSERSHYILSKKVSFLGL